MKRPVPAATLALGLAIAAAFMPSPVPVGASPRIDTAHLLRDRGNADSCVLGAVVIYTDPYIGGRLTHDQVVAAIARMCARPFRIYSEDRGLDGVAARRLLRRTIEAALRGQFRETPGRPALHNAE